MLHVLLLEDSKLDAQIIAAHLEEGGLPVELARVESRTTFERALQTGPVDLILSDYNIPGFGGDEALVVARRECPHTPFIFVSGALGEHAAVELLKRGATDYVLKDRLERLVPSVERALRESSEKAERHKAEERLRERERTLSTLMRNLPGMAFRRAYSRPWRIQFASDGCRPLTGYEPSTLYAWDELGWESVMHPDDVARVEEELRAAMAEGRQLTTTYRIRTASGEERWVWERSQVHPALGSDDASVEGFATDITQQKETEAEVRRRIEFEQQLIGIVSHDLRTPLNSITLGAAALLRQEGLNPAGTRSVRRILASAERAARMIRDLLDFTQARLGGGIPVTPRAVSLHALLSQVVEEFEHSHPERKIDLLEASEIEAEWDPDRIMQALTNLIGNAVAYSPRETTVTLRSRLEGAEAVIEVHNLGEPIPESRMASLFKPLSRGAGKVDLQTRSIGLGLYIVHSIARAHDGEVSVRSSAEDGTTFALRLPRRAKEGSG